MKLIETSARMQSWSIVVLVVVGLFFLVAILRRQVLLFNLVDFELEQMGLIELCVTFKHSNHLSLEPIISRSLFKVLSIGPRRHLTHLDGPKRPRLCIILTPTPLSLSLSLEQSRIK